MVAYYPHLRCGKLNCRPLIEDFHEAKAANSYFNKQTPTIVFWRVL